MKEKIIVLGGGIVGATAAFYLSQSEHQVILIDYGVGTATRAACGVISPWLSQRRNKDWYRLTAAGAAFYPTFMKALKQAGAERLPYQQTGSLVFKNSGKTLQKLFTIALERREEAPMIGDLSILDKEGLQEIIPPLDTDQGALLAKGGGRLDGQVLLDELYALIVQNGGQIIRDQATLLSPNQLSVGNETFSFDKLILAAGAWLPQVLEPLGYHVAVRPQKGQLLEVQLDQNTDNWPGCILQGEIDILPFENGRLVIGATHEDDQGYDLTIDTANITAMQKEASHYIPALAQLPIQEIRVGTRAYTPDFSPFYGHLSNHNHIYVASGLGSSGLTSGPFIGWQLAQEILGNENTFDRTAYSPERYIQRS